MECKTQPFPTLSYLPALTGIRAIAAYMVYCVHFNPLKNYHASRDEIMHFAYTLFHEFGIGVTMFFVLSGFLITLRYADTAKLRWHWFKNYIINRIARVYPMYFLITALTFGVYTLDISYDPTGQYKLFTLTERIITQFLNFSLLRGFSETFKFSGVIQGWSLTVEECFYFSAPVFLAGISLRYRRIFIYPLLLIFFGIAATAICSKLNIWGIFGSFPFLFYYTFFGRCIEFFMGMALALYLKGNPYKQFSQSGNYTALGIMGVMGVVTLMTLNNISSLINASPTFLVILRNVLSPVLICLLYTGLIFEKNIFTKLLKSKCFDLLGKSSYTFYLIHMGVIQVFLYRHLTENSFILFLLLNLLAILLFKTIEEPCHKWIKSFPKPSLKAHLIPE